MPVNDELGKRMKEFYEQVPKIHLKRGSCCIKEYIALDEETLRSYWRVDTEIPIFKGEDRGYIERFILPEEE